jgi:hypothetical protein
MILNEILKNVDPIAVSRISNELKSNPSLIEFLQTLARPKLSDNRDAMANAAGFVAGYMEALENLMYFKEKFLTTANRGTLRPSYGATQGNEYLTEEEIKQLWER